MGKIVASYLARITIREPDTDQPASVDGLEAPTIAELTEDIDESLRRLVEPLEVNTTAERTDQ